MEIKLPSGLSAFIDDQDFLLAEQYRWHALRKRHTTYVQTGVYSSRTKKQKTMSLHRLLLNAKKGEMVDHIDGDGLNNRRANLRIVTASQNQWNRRLNRETGRKGVRFVGWEAAIKVKGRRIMLGHYDTEAEAVAAYDKAALHHFGEFARLNKPLKTA